MIIFSFSVVDCDLLPPVENGSISYSGFKFFDTAFYSCDTGYNIIPNSQNMTTRVCTEDGIWSDDEPSCESE